MLLYVIVCPALLFALLRWIIPAIKRFLSPRLCLVCTALLIVMLAVAQFYLHPLLDIDGFRLAGISFGATDVDDAIDVALNSFLDGRYPYAERTFLNYPITPLPGTLLLALPFHLLGQTPFQNIVWLGMFCWVLGKETSDLRIVAMLAGIMTVFSPNVIYQQINGTDYLANSVYVLTAMLLLLRAVDKGWLAVVVCSAFLGVTLASRPMWLFLVPIVWVFWVYRTTPLRTTVMLVSVAGSFALLVLPFYLYDPFGFTPLHVSQFLTMGGTFPNAPIVVGVMGMLLSVFLAVKFGHDSEPVQVRSAFFVESFLILAGFVLAWIANGTPELYYSHFGIFFVSLGTCAFGPALVRQALAENEGEKDVF